MKKQILAALFVSTVLGGQPAIAWGAEEGQYAPVKIGNDWFVSRDGGKTFSSGGVYPTEAAATAAAKKINRQEKRAAKKQARKESKGKDK
jgi:hypothetical protein